MEPVIVVSAVVLRDKAGRVLLVRKHGTTMWMNPGGKPEPGESAEDCAVREVREELGLELDAARLIDLGEHLARAANESGHLVLARVFQWPDPVATPMPAAEIEEVRWVATTARDADLAPLFTGQIAPQLSRS
ncbi:NUDIX hydrolase [Tessaracoccus lacteus]|uniref:NUDIX domain-containing protein n=1 Tax=Tessaracoccus lacteus TaxID=3041766 RepID=A0ABY8PVW9_9ACTN|nr:NUDIX domain-containing protein [Tessaracoccus sp. T21]WGT46607.1 NUDIX domain-containing protein [Tessaracoccus sp. T21]